MLTDKFITILAFVSLACASRRPFSASSFAGATVSAVFPPKVTETFNASAIFPGEDVVGHPGPTPTGDEAAAIETAPPPAPFDSFYPLVNPPTLDRKRTDVIHSMGNLSPWYSVPSKVFGLPKASPQIPEHCELRAAHVYHRHGARYPTGDSAPAQLAAKLHNATVSGTGFTAKDDLKFLNTWELKLGAEVLTAFGRRQMLDLGADTRIQYGALLKDFKKLPVFVTESEDRMVASALSFASGFFGLDYKNEYHQVIVIEDNGFNNTGAPYDTCTNANLPIGNVGVVQSNKWIATYLEPARKRLQRQIEGINLTVADVYAMQQTCAYETVALAYSEFCGLFTAYEWAGFDYSIDLSIYYSNFWGSPVSVAMGMGLVEELVARLTHTPIATYDSTTNSTIDNSNVTMPLDQPLNVIATHDTVISAMLVALNMTSLAPKGPLPTDHIPNDPTYKASRIIPFGAHVVGQVLSCHGSSKPSHIRWVLNDAVVSLANIKGCEHSDDGLCDLDGFITAMKQRISETDFAFDCLANYTIADPTKITDGRPPPSVRPKAK